MDSYVKIKIHAVDKQIDRQTNIKTHKKRDAHMDEQRDSHTCLD